jgi:hypothetical protein
MFPQKLLKDCSSLTVENIEHLSIHPHAFIRENA